MALWWMLSVLLRYSQRIMIPAHSNSPQFHTGEIVVFAHDTLGAVQWMISLTSWSETLGYQYDLLRQHITMYDVPQEELREWTGVAMKVLN